jgi:uncharacterized phage infection (PIP) family protein YhgE
LAAATARAAELDGQLATAATEAETLKAAAASATTAVASTAGELAAARAQLEAAQAELAEAAAQLQAAHADAATAAERAAAAETSLTEATARADALAADCARLAEEVEMAGKLSTAQAVEIAELSMGKDEAEERLAEVEKEAAGAAAASAAADAAKKELADLQKKMVTLAKEFKLMRGAREAAEAAVQAASATSADARAGAERARAKLKAAEDAAAELTRARDDAAGRAALFEEELRQVRTTLAESQAARKFLEERAAAAERETAEKKARSEAQAKAQELTGGWVEHPASDPAPPFAIGSPVIAQILQSYTNDPAKQVELYAWLKDVAGGKDISRMKRVLEVERAPKEVRDGFLALVVPILKMRADVGVTVQLRERQEVRTDIKLSLDDRSRTLPPANPKAIVTSWRSNG